MKTFYRRNLPHWQPEAQTFFVTFRLWNSLPSFVIERLKKEKERLSLESNDPSESQEEKSLRIARHIFECMDDALAQESSRNKNHTTLWLANPDIADLLQEAIIFRNGKEYDLHRYVIMPNHAHLLITPLSKVGTERRSVPTLTVPALTRIMQGLKRWTALKANRILGRTGRFWQEESFDHCVRDQRAFHRIIRYIDANPIKAGLCEQPSKWRWCSSGSESLQ
jgi:REP element-mobilizing transposase RayT